MSDAFYVELVEYKDLRMRPAGERLSPLSNQMSLITCGLVRKISIATWRFKRLLITNYSTRLTDLVMGKSPPQLQGVQ